MGQNRSDTSVQRASKRLRAERDRCPACNRKSALTRDQQSWDEIDNGNVVRVIAGRVACRWCDYESESIGRAILRTASESDNPA